MASANFHRQGFVPSLDRQRAYESFTSLLMTLRFPRENDMHKLFSFENCEKELSYGDRILEGIGMDGTGVDILGKLPEFVRITCEIEPVRHFADRQ